jgi:hypothetical protein
MNADKFSQRRSCKLRLIVRSDRNAPSDYVISRCPCLLLFDREGRLSLPFSVFLIDENSLFNARSRSVTTEEDSRVISYADASCIAREREREREREK